MGRTRAELEAEADRILAAADAPSPSVGLATEIDFEVAIERQPADDELRRAYALRLEQLGDPRGRLARLRPGTARHRAALRAHRALLFGGAASAAVDARRVAIVSWRFGFASAARVNVGALTPVELQALLDSPACRFLERLVGTWRDEADDVDAKLATAQRHLAAVVDAFASARCGRTIAVVELVSIDGQGQPPALAARSLAPTSLQRRRLPSLRACTARFDAVAPP